MDSYTIIKDSVKLINSNFDEITKIIRKKEIINHTNNFLHTYFKDKNYNSRKFLSGFIIVAFPHVVFNNINNEIDKKLYSYAAEMINCFLEFKENNLKLLDTKIFKFITYFDFWEKVDAKYISDNISESLYMINNLKKDVNKVENKYKKEKVEIVNQEINKIENNILNQCKLIFNNKNLKNYKDIEDIFWEKYKCDLENNPPNHELTIFLIKEIISILKEITPNKYKEIYFKEYDEYLDFDFLKQKIKFEAFDSEQIKLLLIYIIEKIKEFQAAEDDIDTLKWEKDLKKIIKEGYLYSNFLPLVLRKILEKFSKIKNIKLLFSDIINK
jgi:hypothetical protein